jgi:predicted DNA-binding transcriptional regulator AlpA
MENSANKMISPAIVMERLGVCRTTLWRMSKEGDFPKPVRISAGRIVYREEDVELWLAARGAGAPVVASEDIPSGSVIEILGGRARVKRGGESLAELRAKVRSLTAHLHELEGKRLGEIARVRATR